MCCHDFRPDRFIKKCGVSTIITDKNKMKKSNFYIVVFLLVFTAILTGCHRIIIGADRYKFKKVEFRAWYIDNKLKVILEAPDKSKQVILDFDKQAPPRDTCCRIDITSLIRKKGDYKLISSMSNISGPYEFNYCLFIDGRCSKFQVNIQDTSEPYKENQEIANRVHTFSIK